MDERDHGELADRLEREADDLEHRSRELKGQVDQTRQDWERKKADEGVPGARPDADPDPEDGEGEEHRAAEANESSSEHEHDKSR